MAGPTEGSGGKRVAGGEFDDNRDSRQFPEAAVTTLPAAIPLPSGDNFPAVLEAEVETARAFAAAATASATRRAYASDWRLFVAWCQDRGFNPLPAAPTAVVLWFSTSVAPASTDTDQATADIGPSAATLARRLAAIGYMHRQAGHPAPHLVPGGSVVTDVLAGIRRTLRRPPARKAAADGDVIRDVLRAITGDRHKDIRDRALIALGFAGALRRSELAAIRVEDLRRDGSGIRLFIPVSKTDQEGAGTEIAIPPGQRIRPVALVDAWLSASGITSGWLFPGTTAGHHISEGAVALIVKRRLQRAGYDPALYSAHSLRAGFITAAANAGASVFKLKEVSRHRSTDVLASYVRSANLFQQHAGEGVL